MFTKILVTGANGFIGSELITYLVRKGFDVNGISEDIRDKEALRPHFKNVGFVIHAAGKVKKGIPNQEIYYSINVLGTKNIVELCIENNCKLVHLSSVVADRPFTSEIPYSISKLASQNLVENYTRNLGLKAVTLKLCVIYNKENNTGKKGARYPIEKLVVDIENIIKLHDFDKFELIDYSKTRA